MNAVKHDQFVLSNETLGTQVAEAYRALRANISLAAIDHQVKTILVTSAGPMEGKTTTVVNLGIILAQAGPRVLIIDADLRRPSLHHLFGFIPNGKKTPAGLSNVILGQVTLAEALMPSGFARVRLLPSGSPSSNPNELLSSGRMRTVLRELAEEADFVLIDSPPCLHYSDALVLAPATDGVLYVVRSGSQDGEIQRRVLRQLRQTKARMLGVVFNGVAVKDSGAAYYAATPNGGKHGRR